MSVIPRSSRRAALTVVNLVANLAFLALVLVPIVLVDRRRIAAALARADAPDLGVIASASPVVLVHLVAVIGALVLGVFLLVGRKGARLHRALGWSWVVLLAIGAVTSIFLHEIATGPLATGGFSAFHVITAIVLVLLPLAVLAARTHRVRWHAALMIYLLVNALLGAGIFALYPGFSERLLPRAIYRYDASESAPH